MVTITGSLLGVKDYTIGARLQGSPCESTQWVSPSAVLCKVPRGISLSAPITATLIQLSGGNEEQIVLDSGLKFSFDEVRITRTLAVNGPASGQQSLTVVGSNFGSFDLTGRQVLGGTSCEASRWMSNTAVTCKNSPSVQYNRNVVVSLALGRDTLTGAYTYDKMIPQSVFPTNSATFGAGTMTVTGYGFGTVDFTPAICVRTFLSVGGTACMASRWISDTTVLCKLPADTNSDINVVVTLDMTIKTLFRVFSYDNPRVTDTIPSNVPHTGGSVVTINGFNFGASPYNPRAARLGDTACTDTGWTSDTSISCRAVMGNSDLLNTIVSVATVTDARLAFSYDNPILQRLSPSNGPASGLTRITLNGDSFGPFDLTPLVRIGATLCPQTIWQSATSVVCKLASVPYAQWFTGGTEDVYVQIGKTRNLWKRSFTYDAACVGPCIVQIGCEKSVKGEGCSGATQGDYLHSLNRWAKDIDEYFKRSQIRLMGNFSVSSGGPVLVGNATTNKTVYPTEQIYNGDVSVTFGEGLFVCEVISPAQGDTRSVQSYLDCLMPPGVGSSHGIKVVVRNATYRALLDGCTDEMKKYGKTTWPPGESGAKFGNCFPPSSVDDEYVVAKDYGISFSYDAPVIKSVSPSRGANSVGQTANITITGDSFGAAARELYSAKCRISGTTTCKRLFTNGVVLWNVSCASIAVTDGTESTGAQVEAKALSARMAWCEKPEGYTLSCTSAFSDATSGCTKRPLNLCPDKFFGCGRRCPEDTIICTVPVLGGTQLVSVIVGGVTATTSVLFQYDSPVIYTVVPPEVLAGTSSLITVTGRNFGADLGIVYGGKLVEFTPNVLLPSVLRPFSPQLTRNVTTIAWWAYAQYQTCFSAPDAKASTAKPIPVSLRVCDAGAIPSAKILLRDNIKRYGEVLQEMVVQGPAASARAGQTVLSVDIMAQVVASRSAISPENSTFSFRVGCNSNPVTLGTRILMFYIAAKTGGPCPPM